MRIVGYVLICGIIATAAALLLNHGVSNWLPCQGEALACSMDGIFGFLATLVIAPLATLTFGVILLVRPTVAALVVAGVVLLLPIVFLLIMTLNEIAVLRDGAPWFWREYQKLLQIPATPALGVLLQWIAALIYLRRRHQVA